MTINQDTIKNLEKKYMGQLINFVNSNYFNKEILKIETYINKEYERIKKYYDLKNKLQTPFERLISFALIRNSDFLNVIGLYPSAISSDIAYELDDCFINIDAKTVDLDGNEGDLYDISTSPNQNSFVNKKMYGCNFVDHNTGEGIEFKGFRHIGALRKNLNNKPNLTFVLKIIYKDNNINFKLHHKIVQCIPNGILTKKDEEKDLIQNFKTYSYCPANAFGVEYNPRDTIEDHWIPFKINGVKVYYDNKLTNPKFLSDKYCIWAKENKKYKVRLNGNAYRLKLDKIRDRADSEGEYWKGYYKKSF
jgi:hypothetical protein